MNNHDACCLRAENVERCSVWTVSRKEADEYKWIESERAGCDLGEAALKRWVRDHWWGFLRARWLEHLHGSRFWIELDQNDFGLLDREFFEQRALLNEIVTHLKNGKENLDIIGWAADANIPIGPIMNILERLDINGHRMICQFVDN